MRPAALSIAVLLGIAALGGANEARATSTLSATIVIESERTVLVGGKGGWSKHGWSKGGSWSKGGWSKGGVHRHKDLARHHKRWHDGRHHRPAFVGKRVYRAPVVVIEPPHRRSFGYRHLPPRPLIRNGSFARGPYRW
jgi:hypothetical protein